MPQPPFSAPFLWPLAAAASVAETTAALFKQLATWAADDQSSARLPEPAWAMPNEVVLELPALRLRDFSRQARGRATLVCAPYALHGATIADFAPGHSIVEALLHNGLTRVLVTDWRSATPAMRFFSIDTYLSDLNVAVDELDPPVDLVGLCQGAWMALLYAARFPKKVRQVAMVGGPIDLNAGQSRLSQLVANLPLSTFEELVREGEGRVLGHRVLEFWGSAIGGDDVGRVLQLASRMAADGRGELEERFRQWYAWTVDLPGTYYLQVVQQLFKENQIAEGRFVALGRQLDLAELRIPMLLLAGTQDELISMDQLFATARLVGTAEPDIETMTEPCDHLGLFLGAKTLARSWPRIAQWLSVERAIQTAS